MGCGRRYRPVRSGVAAGHHVAQHASVEAGTIGDLAAADEAEAPADRDAALEPETGIAISVPGLPSGNARAFANFSEGTPRSPPPGPSSPAGRRSPIAALADPRARTIPPDTSRHLRRQAQRIISRPITSGLLGCPDDICGGCYGAHKVLKSRSCDRRACEPARIFEPVEEALYHVALSPMTCCNRTGFSIALRRDDSSGRTHRAFRVVPG
jgi:hypothetical protein